MSAPATRRRTAGADTAVLAPEPPARFSDLLAAEWIKTRSLRSTAWTPVGAALFAVVCSAVAALNDYRGFPRLSPAEQRAHAFSLSDAFVVPGWMTLMLLAATAGALAVVGEYGSGQIRATTVAVPARGEVLLAKATVTGAVWTAAGTLAASASFAVSQGILHGRHAGIGLGHPGAFKALVASALLAPVCALVGLGLGALLRHAAGTVAAGAFLLLMVPLLFSPSHPWSAALNHATVLAAWQRLAEVWGSPAAVGGHYASLGAAWTGYAVWPLVLLALGLLAVRRRDV